MTIMEFAHDYRYNIWFSLRWYFHTRRLCEAGMLHMYDFMNDYSRVMEYYNESYNRMQKEYEAYKKRVLKLES